MNRRVISELASVLDRPIEALRQVSPELRALISAALKRQPETPPDAIPDAPAVPQTLRHRPGLEHLVAATRLVALADAANWSDSLFDRLVGLDPDAIHRAAARLANTAATLTPTERHQLAATLAIHRATSDHRAVSAVARTTDPSPASLPLATLERAFTAAAVPDPSTAASTAYSLLGQTLPHARFAGLIDSHLDAADLILKRQNLPSYDPSADLARLTRRFAELDLAPLLSSDWRTGFAEARRRIEQLRDTHTALALSTSFTTRLPKASRTKADTIRLTSQLAAERRALALTDTPDDADRLLTAGPRSAAAIARANLGSTGLSPGAQRSIADRALPVAVSAATRWAAVHDLIHGGFADLAVANLSPRPLASLPGFGELFGDTPRCSCHHCRSVLSPAAYFVDLMCFVADLTRPHTVPGLPHALALPQRRPDLWSLELTCAATDTSIPYLTLVNEVLERAIAARTDAPSAPEDHVYGTVLPRALTHLDQPYARWHDECSTVLAHFGLDLATLAEAQNAPAKVLASHRLGMDRQTWLLTSTPSSAATLHALFGDRASASPHPLDSASPLDPLDPHDLCARAGFTRSHLDALLATRTVSAGQAFTLELTRSSPAAVQPDREALRGLTLATLDRLHRFERLRRHSGLSIGALDLLLEALTATSSTSPTSPATPSLDVITLVDLTRLLAINRHLRAPPEELCLLVGPVPTRPLEPASPALPAYLDRLFADPTGQLPKLPDATLTIAPLTPTTSTTPATPDLLARLQAATSLTAPDLTNLLTHLAPALSNTRDLAPFVASLDNLTLVLRHATLARRLGLTIPAVIDALNAAPLHAPRITTLDDLESLVRSIVPAPPSRTAIATTLGLAEADLPNLSNLNAVLDRTAASTLWGAMRARYPDESAWAKVYEPHRDALLTRRRNALIAWLLHHEPTLFPSVNALYHFYLLDPQMDGCARTSRVVAGIASLQLYVQRIRLDLERSADTTFRIPPSTVDPNQWSWRKNYRVWEANRKVFLWPENWLDPELRLAKTPAFAALERTLSAAPLDADSAHDAYAAYLRDFEEVTSLRLAGTYHDKSDGRDTLHVFGVSSGDTPRTFHRQIDHAQTPASTRWNAWQPVDLQPEARLISPIVVSGRLHVLWTTTTTTAQTAFQTGTSVLRGYRHTLTIKLSRQRSDGTWTPPIPLTLPNVHRVGPGVFPDPIGAEGIPLLDRDPHPEPVDGYAPTTFDWRQVLPFTDGTELRLRHLGFAPELGPVDLVNARFTSTPSAIDTTWPTSRQITSWHESDKLVVFAIPATDWGARRPEPYARAVLVAEHGRIHDMRYEQQTFRGHAIRQIEHGILSPDQYPSLILFPHLRQDIVHPVNGSPGDVLIDDGDHLLYLQESTRTDGRYLLRRLDTSLAPALRKRLSTHGIDGLLATSHQLELAESNAFDIDPTHLEYDTSRPIDFDGPVGVYLQEVYFHVPWRIARALNQAGHFEAAQRWYHYIFDPTAPESPTPPQPQDAHHPKDHVWRYRPFIGLTPESLLDRLTHPAAIAAYTESPFNAHAIAALRPTAYQKAVFMDYVDNLLDWGDALFAKDTRESIGEATLLYVLAQDLLGPRPRELGDCPTPAPLTFDNLGCPTADQPSPFLTYAEDAALDLANPTSTDTHRWVRALTTPIAPQRDLPTPTTPAHASRNTAFDFASRLVDQTTPTPNGAPAFCIPRNDHLDAYWARVEDRLFKIRHCMNLSGLKRQLALFAPPIDPAILVRAAGLGLDLAALDLTFDTPVPLHRFSVLLDRARSLAAMTQSYGASLRAALDRRDADELTSLHNLHRANILTLSTRGLEQDLELAHHAVDLAERRLTDTQLRLDHFRGLLERGLTASERSHASNTEAAIGLRVAASGLDTAAHFAHFIPNKGAPTAMTYGGREVGAALSMYGAHFRTVATALEGKAQRAAIASNHERRDESWAFQVDLLDLELTRAERELQAARLRAERVSHSLSLHRESIQQHTESMSLFDDRFTNRARLDFLVTELRDLYRAAFTLALKAAARAQRAFTFERAPTDAPLLAANYWSAAHAGMLAAERLLLDLTHLEERYLETDHRQIEIHQTFSLAQLDPDALLHLASPSAACNFTLDELHFDLVYPGHFRRRIKSVRLTIPCVTGAYTNVGATLSLISSHLRVNADSDLTEVSDTLPTTTIATSTAQSDGGGFALDFRDARYLPFEGAGAVSNWSLALPRTFRPFDYSTINDVLIHVSYTALADPTLRDSVEGALDLGIGTLEARLQTHPATRTISLRQEFSSAFHRLLHGDGRASLELTDRHFPFAFQGRELALTDANLLLDTPLTTHTLAFNGTALDLPATEANLSGYTLPVAAVGTLKRTHHVTLAPRATTMPPASEPTPRPAIRDILLRLRYTLSPRENF